MLAVVIAGAGYVAFTGGNSRGGGPGAGPAPAAVEGQSQRPGQRGDPAATAPGAGKVRIRSMELTRDYANARLEIEIDYDNRGGAELAVAPPDVVLEAGDGSAVDPFFLAGDFPDPIPAGERDRAVLKYWLKPEHFGGPLVLTVRGEAVPVKADSPFDLESVENQATVRLEAGAWAE